MKYMIKWTTMGDQTKRDFRDELRPMVDVKYHQAIDKGVCDFLFSCNYVEPHDVVRAIRDSEVKS